MKNKITQYVSMEAKKFIKELEKQPLQNGEIKRVSDLVEDILVDFGIVILEKYASIYKKFGG